MGSNTTNPVPHAHISHLLAPTLHVKSFLWKGTTPEHATPSPERLPKESVRRTPELDGSRSQPLGPCPGSRRATTPVRAGTEGVSDTHTAGSDPGVHQRPVPGAQGLWSAKCCLLFRGHAGE